RRGVELAPPVAAEGDQHEARGGVAGRANLGVRRLVEAAEEVVHERGMGPDALGARRPAGVAGLQAVVRGGDVFAKNFQPGAPTTLGPFRLGAGELLPDRRLRPTQAPHQRLSHFEPTLAWGVGGVKPAPPLALRRLTASRRGPYDPTATPGSGRARAPPARAGEPHTLRGRDTMDTSRRQFFQVTAAGLVAASGVAGRVRP